MSDKLNEQLSALMDDECAVPELGLALRRLSGNAELKACWQRYHLIGDTMRNNLPQRVGTEFCDRVHDLIAAEPSLTRPARSGWQQIKPLTGWAVAASLSVAVGLGFSDIWSSGDASSAAPDTLAINQFSPVPGAEESLPVQSVSAVVPVTDSNSRLSNYLLNHTEYSSVSSIRGIVPYMHTVTYNSNP
jgi:sigma-E factor negative regulatory protein RseA